MYNFKSITLALLLWSAMLTVKAQTIHVSGQKAYGTSQDDYAQDIVYTSNGGFAVTGYSQYAPFIVRYDSLGNIQWSKKYVTTIGYAYDLLQTNDGGFLLSGALDLFTGNDRDFLLIKTDANGDTAWTTSFGRSGEDHAMAVAKTLGSGYMVAGYSYDPLNITGNDIMIVKTNGAGDTLLTKIYHNSDDKCYDIIATSGGGFALVGRTSGGILLMKINGVGNIIFSKVIGNSGDVAYAVRQTSDNGFLIAGETNYFGAGVYDMLVIRIDATGNVLWSRTYGGVGNDRAYHIFPSGSSSYIVSGETNSFGAGGVDGYAVQIDLNGEVLWSKTYGGAGNDYFRGMVATKGNDLAFCGYSSSFGSGFADIYLARTDQFGNASCNQSTALTSVNSGNLTANNITFTLVGYPQVRSTPFNGSGIVFNTDTVCDFAEVDASDFTTGFQKTLGSLSDDNCYSADRTTDGGYIFAGTTTSFGSGNYDIYVIKADGNANVIWSKTFGASLYEESNSVLETIDGGFLISGYTNSYGAGLNDGFVIRTNSSGNLLWAKTYGSGQNEEIIKAIETNDGGFALAGKRQTDILLIKTDADGDTTWTRIFSASLTDDLNDIIQTNDGGYMLTGQTNSSGAGDNDIFTIKTDASGDIQWSSTYGGSDFDEGVSIIQTADGWYTIGGNTGSFLGWGSDLFLLRLDSSGTHQWGKTLGGYGGGFSYGGQLATSMDGNYILSGRTTDFGAYPTDFYFVIADTGGSLITSKLFGYQLDPDNQDADNNYSIIQQPADGGYLLAGASESFGSGDYDFYIVKTDMDGNSGNCFESSPATVEQSISFTQNVFTVSVSSGLTTGSPGFSSTTPNTTSKQLNIATSITGTNVSCNGGTNGSANLTTSGGSAPLAYSWSNSTSLEDISQVSAGTYTVTVSDVYGCQVTDIVTITEPLVLLSSISGTNISCYGGSDGTATITPSGGTPPYNIIWNNGQITPTAVNLYPATYTVSIVDAKGCPATNIITLTQPAQLDVTVVGTNVICNGFTTGSANLVITGGTLPYDYNWSGGETTSSISSVAAGTYTVTLTDSCGFTIIDSAVITEPDVLKCTVVATDVSCSGNINGAASAGVTGGTPPYSYAWSAGGTTSSVTGLAPAIYTVTVTDACGSSVTENATISEPAPLVSSISKTNVRCYGSGDGTATVTPSGGTPPYNYSWSSGQVTQTAVGLFPGFHGVNIFDSKGCLASNSVTITQPQPLSATTSVSYVTCNAGSDGSVNITISGGTAPYSFQWSNSASTEDVTGLTAGTYTVTITDSCSSSVTSTAVITQPGSLTLTAIATDVKCNSGNNGSISLTVSGGVIPYAYQWSNSATTEDITNLIAGPFTVTVTDGCSQTSSATTTVNQPAILAATVIKTDISCNGGGNGTATVTASGGTAPYIYNWNNARTTQTAVGLFPGTYSVNVVDMNGCLASGLISITQPQPLSATTAVSYVGCYAGSDGGTDVNVSGGTAPYTFYWSNSETSEDVTGLTAGTYTVTITDSCSAAIVKTIDVTQPGALTITTTVTDAKCYGSNNGSVSITVSGGVIPYTYNWSNGSTDEDQTNLTPAEYIVTVSDGCGQTIVDTAQVGQPGALSTSMTKTDVTCYALGNGTATISVTGGTSPYIYQWNNGQNTQTAIGLFAGFYGVNVFDANYCLASNSVTITQPAQLTATAASTSTATCGHYDGSALISAGGGTSPYTYLWSSGGSNSNEVALAGGTYSASVTDSKGCSATATTVVEVEAVAQQICIVTVNEATQKNEIAWEKTPGLSTAGYIIQKEIMTNIYDSIEYIPFDSLSSFIDVASDPKTKSNRYRITTVDSCGNESASGSSHKTMHLAVNLGIIPPPYTERNLIWENYEGFTAPQYRIWRGTAYNSITLIDSVVSTSTQYTDYDTLAGSDSLYYIIEIVHPIGCTSTLKLKTYNSSKSNTASLEAPLPPLTLTVSATEVSCNGGNDGSATANPGGGDPSYTYVWNNGQVTQTATGLTAGNYSVTVADAKGNTITGNISVTEPAALSLTAVITNANSPGNNDGSIDITVSGGTGAYTFAWDNGEITEDVYNLPADTYAVTVTDANGCQLVVDTFKLKLIVDIADAGESMNVKVYPNPFRDETALHFTIMKESMVSLDVFTLTGQKVETLHQGVLKPGDYKTIFTPATGSEGVYMIRLTVDDSIRIIPVIELK